MAPDNNTQRLKKAAIECRKWAVGEQPPSTTVQPPSRMTPTTPPQLEIESPLLGDTMPTIEATVVSTTTTAAVGPAGTSHPPQPLSIRCKRTLLSDGGHGNRKEGD